MQSTREPTILARDLMRADVAAVGVGDSVRAAVRLIEELHVSGVPVLDADGKLAGVFSESDLERYLRERREAGDDPVYPLDWEEEVGDEAPPDVDRHSAALVGEERVGDWMSPGVIAVAPSATLRDVCRRMSRENVHRVLVEQDGKLVGIVTSFDVVRCLATLD